MSAVQVFPSVDLSLAVKKRRKSMNPLPRGHVYHHRGPDTSVLCNEATDFTILEMVFRLQCSQPWQFGVDEPDGQAAMPIPTASLVSFWAGLVTAVRLIRECLGKQCPANRQQLWLSPLRLDRALAAWWMPVPPSKNCPIQCSSARALASESGRRK